MAKLNLRPLDDRVVVQPSAAEETTAGGIVLPDSAKEKPQRGTILAVGPGKLLGQRQSWRNERGDRRYRDLRQVRWQRHRSEWPGNEDPSRERHSREGSLRQRRFIRHIPQQIKLLEENSRGKTTSF